MTDILKDGKRWGHTRGDLKMAFSTWKIPDNPLKIPWFLSQGLWWVSNRTEVTEPHVHRSPSLLKGTLEKDPPNQFFSLSQVCTFVHGACHKTYPCPLWFGELLPFTRRRKMWDGFGFLPKVQVCAIWGFDVGDVYVPSSWWQPGNFQPEPCSLWSLRAIQIFGSVALLGTPSQPQMDTET